MRYFIFIVFLFCFGCQSAKNSFIDESVDTKFKEGREIYLSKCGGCHQLYDPSQYSLGKLDSIYFPMSEKAKLLPQEKEKVYSFLIKRVEKEKR